MPDVSWRWVITDAVGAAGAALVAEDRPQVLTTRHNLANLRGRAGDAAGAAEELGRLACDMERVHGADHIYTVVSRRAAVRRREGADGGSRGAG
ncbi:hypothetical protein [Streptomyces sp. OR43]|uniref:hypothetical protein n=1 Tax=Streptomyces sp. or43 TaxID=2478957 RepID=UPI0021C63556|nr:hypothetical protein [Streptomyces sp. or43]